MLLTTEEEDKIAKILSDLNPVEYAQLMKKVRRDQWEIKGFNKVYRERYNSKWI